MKDIKWLNKDWVTVADDIIVKYDNISAFTIRKVIIYKEDGESIEYKIVISNGVCVGYGFKSRKECVEYIKAFLANRPVN